MDFDPFGRGAFPVGVRSGQLVDSSRDDRLLPFEVWYPASAGSFGLDLSPLTQDTFSVLPDTPPQRQAAVRDATPEAGPFPLLIYSHTSLGHRRQSTFLCTHLASHGYVVAAVDHTGNSFADYVARAGATLTSEQREEMLQRIISDRVPDLRFLAESLLGDEHVDKARLGLIGWSFGGWAVLATPEVNDRVGAIVALAPGGASNPLPGIIPARLTFDWRRPVPTLLLAAEGDRYTLLDGIVDIYDRTPARKHLFVLRHADHDHFGDHIEVELVPRQHAHLFTRGLALAHFEAALRLSQPATEFLSANPAQALRERGVQALSAHEISLR